MFKKIQKRLDELHQGIINEKEFNQVLQSYFGQLSHCKGYGIRQNLEDLVKLGRLEKGL